MIIVFIFNFQSGDIHHTHWAPRLVYLSLLIGFIRTDVSIYTTPRILWYPIDYMQYYHRK